MITHCLVKYSTWIAAVLTVAYFGFFMMPERDRDGDYHYREFGRLPTIDSGRYKPMDTVARVNLMIITHRQSYYDYETGKRYPATKWMLDVLTTPPPEDALLQGLFVHGANASPAWHEKVFRIENDQILRLLHLQARDGLRYSFDEIIPNIKLLIAEVMRIKGDEREGIAPVDPKKYTLFDVKAMELWEHLNLSVIRLGGHHFPLVIPAPDGSDQWKSFGAYLRDVKELQEQGVHPGKGTDVATFMAYLNLLKAYDDGEKSKFNRLLSEHLKDLRTREPDLMSLMDLEIFFNEFSPFYHCMELYVIIALLGCFSWLSLAGGSVTWAVKLREAAFASMAVVFVMHSAALCIRMYLQGRPPVTNLYSSAVFIGWGCVLGCLILEWIYRNGIGIVVGAVTGFCSLFIAHLLSQSGDTMEMMQAVLDTNFWLATHVTCVTLGYTAAFVAGGMGLSYILLGIFTNMLRKDGAANLTRMTYGVLCAGMFLSFVGTVLGGIWADQSWGRFWGWDPKENGALLIVIWIALILHARWGGMVKPRGIAVLSVLGIIITSWSWFGTNFLGVGLHAYGGSKADAMMTLVLIDFGFLAVAGLGAFLPLEKWESFRPPNPPTPPIQPLSAAAPTSPIQPAPARPSMV